MRITLRQIEVFAAIARTENVSRAAEGLAMSQSAASSALVELERQFDCPLFDRIRKPLRPHPTGRGPRTSWRAPPKSRAFSPAASSGRWPSARR